MFSRRLPDNLEPNAYARLLAKKRAEGARILDLTESNPTRAGFRYPEAEFLAALSDPRSLVYEPDPCGTPVAREAVALYYGERGVSIHPDQVLLTASTSEAYSYLFRLLADPGDSFLVPTPSYPLFELLAGLDDVGLLPYPLEYKGDEVGWRVDLDELERRVHPTSKGLILVNPNNPTGSCLRAAERNAITELCARRGLAIISDEVFSDYIGDEFQRADPDVVRTMVPTADSLCFSLSGLSKVCAMPQLKLGWIVASGPEDQRAPALRRLALIADTYLSVGTPVQHALPRLLALAPGIQAALRHRIAYNGRIVLKPRLEGTPGAADCWLRADGGWYAVLRVPSSQTDEEWALTLLEQDDVLVHPGYFFGFEAGAFLVVSLLTDRDVFEEGIERLVRRVWRSA